MSSPYCRVQARCLARLYPLTSGSVEFEGQERLITADNVYDEIDRQRRNEELRLPENIDYGDVGGLSNEARQRLRDVRPETLGQAARIPGLTPAAVSLLLVHLKKRDRAA